MSPRIRFDFHPRLIYFNLSCSIVQSTEAIGQISDIQ